MQSVSIACGDWRLNVWCVCVWCLVSTEPGAGAGAGAAGKPLATPEDEIRESVATLSLSQSAPAHARAEHTEDWHTLVVGTPLKVKAYATPTRQNKWRATTIIELGPDIEDEVNIAFPPLVGSFFCVEYF